MRSLHVNLENILRKKLIKGDFADEVQVSRDLGVDPDTAFFLYLSSEFAALSKVKELSADDKERIAAALRRRAALLNDIAYDIVWGDDG